MNKLAIPIVLVAVIMVAGIFAFSPVQSASTVHDTVSGDLNDIIDQVCLLNNDDADLDDDDECDAFNVE